MSELTKENILKALSHVEDPDLKKDLVTLGMIKDLVIEGNKVSFSVVLTTPACPMKDMLHNACKNAVLHLVNKEAELDINMTSVVTSGRENAEVLKGVKNIIAVGSGKGGVGKSTVAANLAISLANKGAKVGLLDADIYGPSVPTMFGLKGEKPKMKNIDGKEFIVPIEKYGVKLLSIGFLIDPDQAVVWRGPMISSAFRQFVGDVIWGELDYLIIDLPPGTGDIQLTLAQTVPLTGVVIVTTPQDVAVADAIKAIDMFRMPQLTFPILGVVENMSYFTPAELPDNKYFVFGEGGGQRLSAKFDVPLLAQIPLYMSVREGGDAGTPAVINNDTPDGKAFAELAENVAQQVAIVNNNVSVSV